MSDLAIATRMFEPCLYTRGIHVKSIYRLISRWSLKYSEWHSGTYSDCMQIHFNLKHVHNTVCDWLHLACVNQFHYYPQEWDLHCTTMHCRKVQWFTDTFQEMSNKNSIYLVLSDKVRIMNWNLETFQRLKHAIGVGYVYSIAEFTCLLLFEVWCTFDMPVMIYWSENVYVW